MPTHTAYPARPRRGPLRSPLAAAPHSPSAAIRPKASPDRAAAHAAVPDPRSVTLDEFDEYLRTVNNRDGRPYEEATISAYVFPAKALDVWMTANGIDGDFTTVDTALLNRYFREYYRTRGQGGTHTQQRNLIQLFNYLQREYGHPSPYADGLNHYAEVRGRPKTLSPSFVDDLLEVTGGGMARDFETARDHAIIRILSSEGIRRQELLGMVMHTLPADLLRNPVFRLVPLKGARNAGEGRLVSLAPATARALAVYLHARRSHKLADSEWVWLGTRNRERLKNTGIRKMLVRRAAEAGYAQVTPHQFRHTFSDGWLASGGSEGDLMRLNGWKTRAMVDRYAEDLADQRRSRSCWAPSRTAQPIRARASQATQRPTITGKGPARSAVRAGPLGPRTDADQGQIRTGMGLPRLARGHRPGCGLRRHTPPPPELSPLASEYHAAHFAPQGCTVQTRTLACSPVGSGPAPIATALGLLHSTVKDSRQAQSLSCQAKSSPAALPRR